MNNFENRNEVGSSEVENRLEDSVMRRARLLAEKYSLERPSGNVQTSLDLVNFLKGNQSIEEVKILMEQGGFSGVSITLDHIRDVQDLDRLKKVFEKTNVKINGFHGSLDPFFLGLKETPSPDIISRDYEFAKVLDPEEKVPINYDLVSADIKILGMFQNQADASTVTKTQEQTTERLGINSDLQIISAVIGFVGNNWPKESKRTIVFETRQTILAKSPMISDENFSYITEKARAIFKDDTHWGITIDLGHTVAGLPNDWSIKGVESKNREAKHIAQIIKKYAQFIKMVHVCGDSMSYSVASRKLSERNGVDESIVKDLGLHGVIDNKLVLDLLEIIRKEKKDGFVEVSEIVPLDFSKSYFGNLLGFDKSHAQDIYREQVKLQGQMLGYRK